MIVKIYSATNSEQFQRRINNELFICVQNGDEACAIIEHVDNITPQVLEEMKAIINPEIIKVVGKADTYKMIKSALELIFDNIKFVERESEFDILFNPKPALVRVSKVGALASLDNKIAFSKENPVKVLIVDDAITICNFLKKIMESNPMIKVVGIVNDPLKVEAAIVELKPDVITLDIHMPHKNGVELLKSIQPKFHIPTIMISSISMKEGHLVLDALEAGAVDYIQKPDTSNFSKVVDTINKKIISISMAKRQVRQQSIIKMADPHEIDIHDSLIVIGSSTGGTRALKELFSMLPSQIPPILVVQHIPAEFSRAFAKRLNETVEFTIKEASDGDQILPNQILIAPGGKQMKFVNQASRMYVEITDDAPVNRFKPSVDYLFESLAKSNCEKKIVAAIFTGMGNDGAQGMLKLKQMKQAVTIVQDEASSVVFGMPKEAIKLGCVDHITPLWDAAATLMGNCTFSKHKKAQ